MFYRGYRGLMDFNPIMEKQMAKRMERDVKTGVV